MQGRGLIYKPVVLVLINFSSVFVCFGGFRDKVSLCSFGLELTMETRLSSNSVIHLPLPSERWD